jgi:Xaa-Pro aminopeptidase
MQNHSLMREPAMTNTDNLSMLRRSMKEQGLDGFLIPRTDEYQGEYVPACADRLKWATGFSGSWGFALIGQKQAALFVDGRYTIQAAKETRKKPIKVLPLENASLIAFLKSLPKAATVGFDPWVTSVAEAKRLGKIVAEAGMKWTAAKSNPIDSAWAGRPAAPAHPIFAHPIKLAGVASVDKLKLIAETLKKKNADATILSDPHSVAWALNIRGSDITHTPIALLRAVVHANGKADLFIEKSRCPADVLKIFGKKVRIAEPAIFEAALRKKGDAVLIDPSNCPEAIRACLSKAKVIEGNDPCIMPRARKNRAEQNGTREAHIRDGAAMANFLAWFEKTAPGSLTEMDVQNKLASFRNDTGKCLDLSFGTISASGPNAALPHYHAVGRGRKLRNNEIFLIDSGGQYRDGTTDVTRTVIVGTPSKEMKQHFTLVLKGMISVCIARFPAGTTGVALDGFARNALWQHGHDFNHGTGHGVGSYLSVHEGPARISKSGHVALEPGMILSNEPGHYIKGKYGIRIENLLIVKPAGKIKGGLTLMHSFECITFVPIDKRLIDEELLTRAELQWLDNYHAEVLAKIGPLVKGETRSWLESACAPFKHKA